MATTIRYRIFSIILTIGICALPGQAKAFDLGGALNQIGQTIQQQEKKQENQQEKQQSPSAQATNQRQSEPVEKPSESKPGFRKPGQSMQDFQKESQESKLEKARLERMRMVDAITPEFIETSEPLELKGIKVGMTVQELLKLHPQGTVINPKLHTLNWVNGDTIVTYAENRAFCEHSGDKTNCKPITVMQKKAFMAGMFFFNNKLVLAQVYFSRHGVKSNDSNFVEDQKHYYDEIFEGLTGKYKVAQKSKDTVNGKMRDTQFRITGWRNNACKCDLVLLEDARFTDVRTDHVMLKWTSDEYASISASREKTLAELADKANAEHEAKRASDL